MVGSERDTTARAPSGHASESSRMSGTFSSLFRSRLDAPTSSTRPNDRPSRPVSTLVTSNTARPPAASQNVGQPAAHGHPHGSVMQTSRPQQPYMQQAMRPSVPQSAPVAQPYYQPQQHQQQQQQQQQQHFPNAHQPISAPATYHSFPPPQHARPPYNYQQMSSQQAIAPASVPYAPHGYTGAAAQAAPSAANQGMTTSQSSAELEAALLASKDTAAEDDRKREAREREEAEHYAALHASEEQERARKLEEEEEEMLRQVMEASEREEREAQERRQALALEEEEEQRLLLEESRQAALRDEEERVRRQHAELIARSKREADEEERQRQEARVLQEAAEQEAVDQSLREMENEWRRREEAERAMTAHVHQGGQLGSASYWQQLDQKKAYDLALKMDKRLTLGASASTSRQGAAQSAAGSSSRTASRPLPPTPGMAALQAGVERDMSTLSAIDEKRRLADAAAEEDDDEVWVPSDDEELLGTMGLRSTTNGQVEAVAGDAEEDDPDPFSDQAEAPPTYDEVREDRPPEAPTTIPEHVRFAPPPIATPTTNSSTIAIAEAARAEKSAAYTLEPGNNSSSSTSAPVASMSAAAPPQRTLPATPAERPCISTNVNSTQSSATPSSPVPPSASPSLAPSSITIDTRTTRPTTVEESSRRTSSATIATEFKQKAMKGTDFGYCSEPFSTTLDLEDEPSKACFPNLIQLRKCGLEGRLNDGECFFVIRAPSWKAMLRALAWYGNTRIVAGPQEVVDHPRGVPMRIEVEFVTPSASPLSTRRGSESSLTTAAYVSVCLSLALPSWADAEATALASALKKASRALDAAYLRQGATRRVIALPSQAPVLPMDMVRLAQHMHRAHIFSAACPSTSAKALHSPRDLHHAVERHDVGYVAKLQRRRRDAAARGPGDDAAATISAGLVGSGLIGGGVGGAATGDTSINTTGRAERNGKNRMSVLPDDEGADKENHASNDDDEDDDEDDGQGDILDAYAVEIVEGDDRDPSRMARMRARVRRKLAKRSGHPRLADDDLQSWITPYDMTQHG